MKILTVNSYAKINIGLKIINQRIDSYHNIETVFQEVQFHDIITIKKINEGYKLSSNNVDFPMESSNTCVQAYLRLKKEFPKLKGVKIHINKNIPMGSGLGGGSSNAASTIIGINNLYDIGLTTPQLKNISQDIGADVPFFIEGGIQHGQGIGDKLTPLKIKLPYTILLVFPNNTVNTRWAYSQIRNKLEIPIKAVNFADLMEKEMIPFQLFENDFEKIVFSTYPEIGLIKSKLLENNARFASLSGSGSTVFGFFNDEADAISAELLFSKSFKTIITQSLSSR
ncbi:MAG: 4-(cytidine 5'-diphospho)-2-C-methyl-D-erythritol kinase [Candidatus Marinimicrobia bacterium]|nr:4-(cytidine 5'-diphospho)-2-C-methyl-D-erythritol kinase [Candidatus Neomarinimicrobiota bacterium]